MTAEFIELQDALPTFALVLARVGAAMALLPGLGEAVAPASVRIGLAISITVLLMPGLVAPPFAVQAKGLNMMLMVISEVVTGLWFGWITRMIVLALPIAAQYVSFLIGLSSVLQPDPELGSQSTALGKLFELAAPLLMLLFGLYTLPLKSLNGLFQLIPLGQLLPAADTTQIAMSAVITALNLALQLASPFVVVGIVWHLAMGQIARMASRMQIYFVSMPGQIIFGLMLLMLTASAIIMAWHDGAQAFLNTLPGTG